MVGQMDNFDAVIVGAGPAGLNAALILGRSCRRVLVCDAGNARNAVSHALHGFLTRDGMAPLDLRRVGREQLQRYPNVQVLDVEVIDVRRADNRFTVSLAGGKALTCRKLLLATGVVDRLPSLNGFHEFYGRSVFHCPYCEAGKFADSR